MTQSYSNYIVGIVFGVLKERSLVDKIFHDTIFKGSKILLQDLVESKHRLHVFIIGKTQLLIQIGQFEIHRSMSQLRLGFQIIHKTSSQKFLLLRLFFKLRKFVALLRKQIIVSCFKKNFFMFRQRLGSESQKRPTLL